MCVVKNFTGLKLRIYQQLFHTANPSLVEGSVIHPGHSATQPLSHSARVADAATQPLTQPLSHSATLPEWLDQPLSHSVTQSG